MLGAILGAHAVLFALVSVNDSRRGVRSLEEASGILFIIEFREPNDTPIPSSPREAPLAIAAVRDGSITLPVEVEGMESFIDWSAEAGRVAAGVASRPGEKKQLRSLDRRPVGMGQPPPKPQGHQLGDSQHFEGGEIITWVGPRCYYSNRDTPIAAFGQALRLQTPVCTGAAGDGRGGSLPTIEEWKKERDGR